MKLESSLKLYTISALIHTRTLNTDHFFTTKYTSIEPCKPESVAVGLFQVSESKLPPYNTSQKLSFSSKIFQE